MLDERVVETLRSGGVVVLRTDTLYGLLARADNAAAVERVYRLKHRDASKSSIVLISSIEQMFDPLPAGVGGLSSQSWPVRTTIVLPTTQAPAWVARDNASVAYRIPNVKDLQQLINLTGPLIAPSANPEGLDPAVEVGQAVDYFGDMVDVYVDGGRVEDDRPSQILRLLDNGDTEQIR